MAQEKNKIQKDRIDHKFSAYVFLVIIFCLILGSLIVDSMAQSSGADLGNFWESSVFSIIQYGILLGAFFIFCRQLRLKKDAIPRAISIKPEMSVANLVLIVLLAGLTLVSFMLLAQGVSDILIGFGYTPVNSAGPVGVPQYIMAVFVLCLLPAVIEEMLFRGFILKGLLPMGKFTAVIASAFLFSLYHLNPEQVIFQFILGIVLAVIVLKTGNLLYGMILHFLNNFAVITTYTFLGDPVANVVWSPLTIAVTVGLAVIGTLMICLCAKILQPHDEQRSVPASAKFWSFQNFGYFVAAALGICVFSIMLVSRLG